MNTVKIDSDERSLADIDANWVTRKFRQAGGRPCLILRVTAGGVDTTFATAACGAGGGSGSLNDRQRELLELWRNHDMDDETLVPGKVVAFLRQAERAAR